MARLGPRAIQQLRDAVRNANRARQSQGDLSRRVSVGGGGIGVIEVACIDYAEDDEHLECKLLDEDGDPTGDAFEVATPMRYPSSWGLSDCTPYVIGEKVKIVPGDTPWCLVTFVAMCDPPE